MLLAPSAFFLLGGLVWAIRSWRVEQVEVPSTRWPLPRRRGDERSGALFIRAAFIENMPLTLFLGLCTFLALSRRPETAVGLGVAVIAVMGVTVPLNHALHVSACSGRMGVGRLS